MAIESQVLAVLAWLAVLKLVQLALWPALATALRLQLCLRGGPSALGMWHA